MIGWAADGKRLPEITLSAEAFAGMGWPLKKWGLAANVKSGNGVREQLREAIQTAGDLAAVRKVNSAIAVVARLSDPDFFELFSELQVTDLVYPELEAGLEMTRQVLLGLRT